MSERLRKAEEAAEKLNLAQRVCPDCDSAIPGIPEHLMIGSSGVLLIGKGCSTCFELGGGAIPLDDRGAPKVPFHKLVMMFDPGSGVETLEEWVDKYGHLRFGPPIDAFLRVHRAELDGQGYQLAQKGVKLHVVQKQLGHSRLDTTATYIGHLTPKEIGDEIRRTFADE